MYSRLLWQLAVALPFTFAVVVGFTDSKRVFAQLTPDDTLGTENSIVTPQQLRDLIQGGAIRDSALFHSFDEFNVGSDRGVFFDLQNNTDILNIFTRVTGGNVSNILGTLGVLQDALNSDVLGNANLFLLNPNGITFGGNANLQLNGSFFATTADGFGFDNFTFSASGEEAPPPLLTISIPRFLDFRNNAGNVAVNQSNLSVNQGQNLSLVGGNVNVNNANLTANGGTIQIAGLSGNGSVDLSQGGFSNNLNIGFADTTIFNSGSVTINASEVNTDNGDVFAGFAGDIYLDAVEEIRVTNNSTLSSNGNRGIIDLGFRITPEAITINNSQITAEENTGLGFAGTVFLNATDVILRNGSTVSADGDSGESRDFGRIFIGNLGLTETVTINNSTLSTNSIEAAQNSPQFQIFAGNITIDASEDISLTNSTLSGNGNFSTIALGSNFTPNTININNSDITAQENIGVGLAGDVFFDATDVAITDSNININGNSGRIFIGNLGFTETVTINNSTLSTDSTEAAQAFGVDVFPAGTINIDSSEAISLTNSTLSSNGNFGIIDLGFPVTPNTIIINNSDITAQEETGVGFAGDVFLDATNVTITDSKVEIDGDFGRIFIGVLGLTETVTIDNSDLTTNNISATSSPTSATNTNVNAGSIIINSSESLDVINDSTISANTLPNSNGTGGNISIDPERVTIQDSTISVNSQGSGPAGTITLDADNLTLDNGQITAITNNSDGGDITLEITDLLRLVNGSNISTDAGQNGGNGEGGNIDISARFVVATPTENNDISANADRDDAGNVTIRDTEIIFGIQPRDENTSLSDITATSEVGADGTISINNQQATDPSQGLIELPEEVADESTFVAGGVCSVGEGSEFIVRGRGGIPYIPGLVTQNDVINIDLVDEVLLPAPPPEAIKPHHRTDVTLINSEGEEYKPAMGAVLLPNGMVEFVDYNPAEVYRDMYAAAGCSR